MSKQSLMWASEFGDEYARRNSRTMKEREGFWQGYGRKHKRILEVGCGDGKNVVGILRGNENNNEIYGVDVNLIALDMLNYHLVGYESGMVHAVYGKATDIPFKDNFFDLVFTCGLLIHIPPEDLLTVMSEMIRCSRKYVMMMEYYAEEETMIPYHGEDDMLWKRPYAEIFINNFSRLLENYMHWKQIDGGFLGKDDGFDDVNWWLFERTGNNTG